MLRAKIKSLEIVDAPGLNPEAYEPIDVEDFGCTFGLTVGPIEAEGGELFYLTVCTPKWLARTCDKDGFVWGRHHLIVRNYDLEAIVHTLGKFLENCSEESWQDVALKVSRYASWEFEDYVAS